MKGNASVGISVGAPQWWILLSRVLSSSCQHSFPRESGLGLLGPRAPERLSPLDPRRDEVDKCPYLWVEIFAVGIDKAGVVAAADDLGQHVLPQQPDFRRVQLAFAARGAAIQRVSEPHPQPSSSTC